MAPSCHGPGTAGPPRLCLPPPPSPPATAWPGRVREAPCGPPPSILTASACNSADVPPPAPAPGLGSGVLDPQTVGRGHGPQRQNSREERLNSRKQTHGKTPVPPIHGEMRSKTTRRPRLAPAGAAGSHERRAHTRARSVAHGREKVRTADDWVNGTCPSAGRSSAVKRNEVPTPAATWARPQSTGLREGSRTQRQHARWFRYTDGPEQTDSWGQGQGPRWGDGYGERGLFPK